MLREAIMKKLIIVGALCAMSPYAFAQVAPTPAPMEGGSSLSNDIATHWASLTVSLKDFARTVGAMQDDYAKVTNELRQTKAELADAHKQLDALKPTTPVPVAFAKPRQMIGFVARDSTSDAP
jgi:phage shock protein A